MVPKCKICSLSIELTDEVNSKILAGESFEAIAKWLKESGMLKTCSNITIHRHSEHLKGYQAAEPLKQDNPKPEIPSAVEDGYSPLYVDVNDQLDQLGIDPKQINPFSADGIRFISKRYLQQITLNQMAIVLEKQSKQMLGEASYPHFEVKGMIELLSLAGYLKPESKLDGLSDVFGGLK